MEGRHGSVYVQLVRGGCFQQVERGASASAGLLAATTTLSTTQYLNNPLLLLHWFPTTTTASITTSSTTAYTIHSVYRPNMTVTSYLRGFPYYQYPLPFIKSVHELLPVVNHHRELLPPSGY